MLKFATFFVQFVYECEVIYCKLYNGVPCKLRCVFRVFNAALLDDVDIGSCGCGGGYTSHW
jgi:hypothetical protein